MCKKSSWCIMLGMLIDAKLCPECFLSTHYVWIQLRCWCSVTSPPRAQRSYRTKTFSVYEAADTVAVTLSPLTAAQYLHQISTIYTRYLLSIQYLYLLCCYCYQSMRCSVQYIDWRNDFWVCPFPIKRSTTPSKFSVLLMPPQLELGQHV